MNSKNYYELLQWVDNYIKSYHGLDEEIDANIKLKEKHTYLVVNYGKEIAKNHLNDEESYLTAVVSCLLHDIGRFSQFKKYRTFRDKDSFDHSLIALDIIFSNNLLKNFTMKQQAIIEKAIYFHNKISIEESLSNEEKIMCKLVRDADKLDIFRVITEYYDDPKKHKHKHVGKNLSDRPEYTKEILESFLKKETIDYNHLVTKCDMKLLQLAWVFDLNYSTSLRIVKEKDYVNRLLNHLPEDSVRSDIEKIMKS